MLKLRSSDLAAKTVQSPHQPLTPFPKILPAQISLFFLLTETGNGVTWDSSSTVNITLYQFLRWRFVLRNFYCNLHCSTHLISSESPSAPFVIHYPKFCLNACFWCFTEIESLTYPKVNLIRYPLNQCFIP